MVKRYISFSSVTKYVITLAPPLFPFPLLLIAILTLNVLFPNEVPVSGFPDKVSLSSVNSLLSDGYFLKILFASFLNHSIGITL